MALKTNEQFLTIPFLDADVPKVWRVDVARLTNVAFEVQPLDKTFVIVMRASGVDEQVAVYSDKNKAIESLSKLITVLDQGSGAPDVATGGFWRWCKKLLKFLIGTFVILFLLLLLKSIFFAPRAPITGMADAPAVKIGVPQSAEDLFGQ